MRAPPASPRAPRSFPPLPPRVERHARNPPPPCANEKKKKGSPFWRLPPPPHLLQQVDEHRFLGFGVVRHAQLVQLGFKLGHGEARLGGHGCVLCWWEEGVFLGGGKEAKTKKKVRTRTPSFFFSLCAREKGGGARPFCAPSSLPPSTPLRLEGERVPSSPLRGRVGASTFPTHKHTLPPPPPFAPPCASSSRGACGKTAR